MKKGPVHAQTDDGGLVEIKDDKPTHSSQAKDEDDDEESSSIPVDRGWAWVICAVCILVTYITSMYDQVLAVMLVDVVEKFDVSVAKAAVVFTVFSLTFSVGSVISTNVLVPRFGVRKIVTIASIFNALTSIILAFSMNHAFYVTVHIFKGLAAGSMWIPTIGLLGQYFNKRRSFATSLVNAGNSLALLSSPPLVRLLLNTYGILGSLLIISGVEMHAIALVMFLRSPSHYKKYFTKFRSEFKNYTKQKQSSFVENADLKNNKEYSESVFQKVTENSTNQIEIANESLKERHYIDKEFNDDGNVELTNNAHETESILCNSVDDNNTQTKTIDSHQEDSKLNEKDDHLVLYQTGLNPHQLDCNEIDTNTKQLFLQINTSNFEEDTTPPKNNSHKNKVSMIVKDADTECMDEKEKHKSGIRNRRTQYEFLSRFVDMKLLNDWLMRLLMVSTIFGVMLSYIPSYIPTLAIKRNVDKTLAAMLLTICGAVNLVSSICLGLFIDCKIISATKFVVISQIAVGTICHLIFLFKTFHTLLILSIAHGIFGGARMSLMPIIAMDFVGVDNLSKALGFNVMVATLSLAVHHPLLGYIIEATNEFNITFHYVGLALYLSAGLLLLEKFGRKLNDKRHIRSQ